MKAMILAAGLGTRLRPLTNDRPKALVEISGRTMLEITIERLSSAGVSEIIVNVHHHADMVVDYLKSHRHFGMRIEISREETLLDTGGGLKKAAWFFQEDHSNEPFVLHNVDVLNNIDLHKMIAAHKERGALATMAVQHRQSSRMLLFDAAGILHGRFNAGSSAPQDKEKMLRQLVPDNPGMSMFAFCGIHLISPALLSRLEGDGAFSIIDSYLQQRLPGEPVVAFNADGYYWRDLGKPESVAQAALDIQNGIV